jgi:tetratricopeptide (TPR) repeat protein
LLRDNPTRAAAEPEAVAHHFTQAGLDGLAIEWWGKAGDQALRRSAFQEAISHLGKAIAMADAAGDRRAADVSNSDRQLHVAYGNALIAARGYGAPETTEAFARARKSMTGHADARDRLAADYGLWVGSYIRGELPSMMAHAATFLSDVEANPNAAEPSVAHRAAGITHWFAGQYREAQQHLERALAIFELKRDDDLAFRFGHDAGVAAMICLAFALWPLGNVTRAISLVARAWERLAGVTHAGTLGFGSHQSALFELMRRDRTSMQRHAVELGRRAREHELPMFRAFAVFLEAMAKGDGADNAALEGMRRGIALLHEQKGSTDYSKLRSPRPKPPAEIRKVRSRFWTEHWRRQTAPAIGRS